MTEAEWLGTNVHAQGMVWHLRGTTLPRKKSGRRKLRLFAVGCCRQFWEHLWDERLRRAIDVAERVAEGQSTKEELEQVRRAIEPLDTDNYHAELGHSNRERTATSLVNWLAFPAAFDAAFSMTGYELPLAGFCGGIANERGLMADLVRDVFGNPFRPVAFDPAWRTDTAVSLARTMYDSREFGAMSILADALQDAGCEDEQVLNHCRDANQPHLRGCWVCDLVLGKA